MNPIITYPESPELARGRLLSVSSGKGLSQPKRSCPPPLNAGRSRNMRANRRADTKPELALRSELHARGWRFRKDLRMQVSGVWVRPDVVFTRRRVAVFVDGCFWHVCPEHGRDPKTNEWYWAPKLRRNLERDQIANKALSGGGWCVVRVWEHEPLQSAVNVIERALTRGDQGETRRRILD